ARAQVTLHVTLEGGDDQSTRTADGLAPGAGLSLDLKAGAGNDTVALSLGAVGNARVGIEADLGGGADTFSAMVTSLAANARFKLDLDAGAGADAVTLNLGDIGHNARVDIEAALGGGADTFSAMVTSLAAN